jgi:ABC-type Fe3+-hydroxamate transport system substrate-binding protein
MQIPESLLGSIPLGLTPRRVVSLVPSLTESLFDLGFGETVVGITDYCVYPQGKLDGIQRVGGTKDARLADILDLQPDLVLANQEENLPGLVKSLEEAGVRVWVTFPQTVRQALDVLWGLVGIYASCTAALTVETLERSVDWAEDALAGAFTTPTYFCPIWHDQTSSGLRWWMTFNAQTYASDILRLCGGANAFALRERRYPLDADLGLVKPQPAPDRDTRYPRLTLDEIRKANPDIILLPSEPYAFDETSRAEFFDLLPECEAVRQGRVFLVDGSLITWHGTRLARALQELPAFFSF